MLITNDLFIMLIIRVHTTSLHYNYYTEVRDDLYFNEMYNKHTKIAIYFTSQ